MAVQDVEWANRHAKFVDKRLRQLGLSDAPPPAEALGGRKAAKKGKNGKSAGKKDEKMADRPRGKGLVPGAAAAKGESVYALLGSSASSANLFGAGEAPSFSGGRSSTPPPAAASPYRGYGGSPAGRGAGGHKSLSGRPASGASRQGTAESDLGAGGVMRLMERLRAEGGGGGKGGKGQPPHTSPMMEGDAVALGLVPGYATGLSPRARGEMVTGRRGAPSHLGAGQGVEEEPTQAPPPPAHRMLGTSAERLGYAPRDSPRGVEGGGAEGGKRGYALKDATAFPMGGAGGKPTGGPFGLQAPSDAPTYGAAAARSRKEQVRAEELAQQFAAARAEEEAARGAWEAKTRAQAEYARDLAEQAAVKRREREEEKAFRLGGHAGQGAYEQQHSTATFTSSITGGRGRGRVQGPPESFGGTGYSLPGTSSGYGAEGSSYSAGHAGRAPVYGGDEPRRAGRGAGAYSPSKLRTEGGEGFPAQPSGLQPSPIATSVPVTFPSRGAAPYEQYGGMGGGGGGGGDVGMEEVGGGEGRRGGGGAAIAALRNSLSTLQGQVARLTEESSRLTAENARLSSDNARLSFDASRLSHEAGGAGAKARAAEGEVHRLMAKLQQAADTLDRYVGTYGPLGM